ncbi:GNAT family N-acetyltransferase [Streptomyces roseirectus]|uniref:GNAT family N-acetyltransferase n=1 Tax=Streptomyces roseirectus TaxID=2768066 RepID=A0A7H0ITB2_9ACTN|nr:GNAT family N-acetyltransferase [Streptomyces roseirectus]QNP76028.1 GNAT family N-acetyltransferase [Streptomyces roseirectus]
MEIMACRFRDLFTLEEVMPSNSVDGSHPARFARQRGGRGTYLIPWLDGRPVGHAEVRWTGCEAPEVQAAHPGCPEINGLFVWPEELRSQGIGTALIRAAEEPALTRARLGYRPGVRYVDRWSYRDPAGGLQEHADRAGSSPEG